MKENEMEETTMAKATKTEKTTKAMTAMENNTSALTVGFDALKQMGDSLSDEMEGLSAAFEQIRIPIGGITYFEMPSDDPENPETMKEFSAVILHHHPMRAYYKDKYTGGNNPPDCGSFDAVEGTGEPGGECEYCLYNQFGTGENGAKACKERRRLYLLLEGEMFPLVLSLPTGSLKDFSRYLMRCLPKWGKSSAGITRFSLVKAVNKGGIAYTKVQFQMGRPLTEGEIAEIEPIMLNVKAMSQTLTTESENERDEATASRTEAVVKEKMAG